MRFLSVMRVTGFKRPKKYSKHTRMMPSLLNRTFFVVDGCSNINYFAVKTPDGLPAVADPQGCSLKQMLPKNVCAPR